MKWLVLLVVAELVTASDFRLGDRIIATQLECDRIKRLSDSWNTKDKDGSAEAAELMDIHIVCEDSLNSDKQKYIEENKMDLSWYKDTFEVETSGGPLHVPKPTPKLHEVMSIESAKEVMAKYIAKHANLNSIHKLLHLQSELGQKIVDKQVECQELAMEVFKHPEDETSAQKQTDCITELNCIKESFMKTHEFTRKDYKDSFPILYKDKGIVVKTPAPFDNSACKQFAKEGRLKEVEKWINGVEQIGEKIAGYGEAGTDFIEHLLQKERRGEKKILSREEFAKLLADAESITIDDMEDEDKDESKKKESSLKIYSDLLTEKLSELEAKGIQIVRNQNNKEEPTTDENKGENNEETQEENTESTTKIVYDTVKDGLTIAKNAAEVASTLVKEGGTALINKLMGKSLDYNEGDESEEEEDDEAAPQNLTSEENESGGNKIATDLKTVLDTLINRVVNPAPPSDQDTTKVPSPLQILKEITRPEGDTEKLSDDEVEESLQVLRESAKKKAENLQLSRKEILESAEIVKGVINTILSAANHGYGAAKDMLPQEIEKAKALVDELVNYATEEILGEKEKANGDANENNDDEKTAVVDTEAKQPVVTTEETENKDQEFETESKQPAEPEETVENAPIVEETQPDQPPILPSSQHDQTSVNLPLVQNTQPDSTSGKAKDDEDKSSSSLNSGEKPDKKREETTAEEKPQVVPDIGVTMT